MSNSNPEDARRPSNSRSPYKIYYIFSEGEKTESLYFNALDRYKDKANEIEIKVMDRWTISSGNSNQYKLTQRIEKYITEIKGFNQEDLIRIKEIMNNIKEQNSTLKEIFELNRILEKMKIDGFLHDDENFQQQINAVLTMSDYQKDFDEIYIVIDRDKQSFKDFQYDEVLEIANRNDYKLGISNPNFEFFLLLHIKNMQEIDENDLIGNPKVSKSKRLMESMLKEHCEENSVSFKKNRYDCEWFLDRFETGYENSLYFENKVHLLKTKPGSSVFNLIEKLIDRQQSN